MSAIESQPPHVRVALDEFKRRLTARWPRDLVAVCLFGSRARGEANSWSDVDVAVVLERAGFREKKDAIDIASDVGLEHDLLISPTVFDRATYERWRRQERPLVMDIEREGVPL